MKKTGSLVNVGLGMTLGAHITPISRSYIEKADVVFVGASNNLVEQWVETMNDNVISLQQFYKEGSSRMITYKKMVEVIMQEVRKGKKVCGAFYGHPGVFSWPPHQSIKQAQSEGFKTHMEPGISAEDCLYADLAIDPGTYGCIHYEATQFLYKNKKLDTTSYVVLWQVGVVGDKSLTKFSVASDDKQVLVEALLKYYQEDQEVILYECALLPIENPRIERIKLCELAFKKITLKTTVVIPPVKDIIVNKQRV